MTSVPGGESVTVAHGPAERDEGAVTLRIGLIIPSSNVLTEPQFRAYAPPDVQTHVTRLRMTGAHHVPVRDLMSRIQEASEALADARCDVIVFHCTASSTEAGVDGDREIVAMIERATGRRATSTASALLAAMEALDVHRIVLVTPYTRATNDHEIAYFREAGIEVLADRALDLGSANYPFTPSSFWVKATEEAADPRADGYLLSCTNVQAPPVIETLEARLGRPVVASNPATLWHVLRLAGRSDVVPGLGRLMALPGAAAARAGAA